MQRSRWDRRSANCQNNGTIHWTTNVNICIIIIIIIVTFITRTNSQNVSWAIQRRVVETVDNDISIVAPIKKNYNRSWNVSLNRLDFNPATVLYMSTVHHLIIIMGPGSSYLLESIFNCRHHNVHFTDACNNYFNETLAALKQNGYMSCLRL